MTLADGEKFGEKEQRWDDENVDLTASGSVGEDLVVELKLSADECQEELHFVLLRGDVPMPSDRYQIQTRGNVVQLTLKESQKEDAGHYALVAKKLSTGLSIPGDEKVESRRKIRLSIKDPSQSIDEGEPPIFIRRLSDLAVKVGTRTRFLVEIRSSTSPKITWHKNDEPVQSGSRFSFVHEGNFYCVDVAPVMVDDQGNWTCMAENGGGRSSCTSFLNVIVPKAYKKPEFVEELRALLTETGTVSLECKVVGVPTPVLKWFKDQKEIKAGDVFALTANPDDPTSLGTYTCEAVNCMGTACSSSRVHVVGKGSREGSLRPADALTPSGPLPVFKKILRDEACKIGDSLTLSCQVLVPPWPKTITWYNKEGRVEPSEKYRVIEDGLGGYSIEIKGVEAMDEGEWKCVATSPENMKQFSTCYVAMSIPKNYRMPRFMESLKAVLTEEGLVSFECKVVGFPTPLLRWFKDGQELHPGDVYQLTGTNSLGSYCCIARNCMGEAKSIAELTVEDIQNQLNEEERMQLMSTNQAPKFVKGLRSCEARINEDFTFTIQVSVSPEPSLSWYRDDVAIIESEKYRLAREALGTCHLEVRKLEFMDQAEWKCVAANDFGHSVTSCFLKLVIPKHFKKPKFLESLRAILSEEGAVNLECKVIGVPQPVLKWYKDGVELKPGDIHRIISGQDGTCCLGTYTCEATNCMGSVSSSASLLGFEDRVSVRKEEAKEPPALHELARNLSLSTIHEERTSQLYDTPQTDHSITLDDRGEVSFSFDGKEVSVSLYETPDLTEEEALQIVEMYADQLSEHITEGNIIELPPMRFTKETSTTGNLLMEAVVIDVSPDYFIPDDADDLRTEADVEDVSIMDDQMQSLRSLSYVSSPTGEIPSDRVPSGSPPSRPPRRKESRESASSRSERSEKSLPKGYDWSESYHSAKEPSVHAQSSIQGQDDSGEAFTDALSSSGAGRSKLEEARDLYASFVEQTVERVPVDDIDVEETIATQIGEAFVEEVPVKRKKKKKVGKGSRTPSLSSKASSEESYGVEPEEKSKRRGSKSGKEKGERRGSTSSNKSTGKAMRSRSSSGSVKFESAASMDRRRRESDATIMVDDIQIEETEEMVPIHSHNKVEPAYSREEAELMEERPASAISTASTLDSEKSVSKTNKERLLENVYKLSEPVMALRNALIDLDSLLPLLQTQRSSADGNSSQMEIAERIVVPVENLCEQVSVIETKALKSAGDRSLAQNVRISLLEAIGGPTEELLRGIELIRGHGNQQQDPRSTLIVLESLTDPVDEILVGLTRIEHELSTGESGESSLLRLEKPIALERMCRAVSYLGTNVGQITERNLAFGDESASCSVIERLQSAYQSLEAFLSTVPLNDVSGTLENNVDTLVVETLVRPLEEVSRSLHIFSTANVQSQSEQDNVVAGLEKSLSEMSTRLEALTAALEIYEKESGEQGITELHADLVTFLRYTMDDAVERLEKLKLKKKRVTQETRVAADGGVTPIVVDGQSSLESDKSELAIESTVESSETEESNVLKNLAEDTTSITNKVNAPSMPEAAVSKTPLLQEKSIKLGENDEKSLTEAEEAPSGSTSDTKKKKNKKETFPEDNKHDRNRPQLDTDLPLPEMLLDPLIDVQANLSDVISDFESQESAEESSLPGGSELAACLTELRECVATAAHTATTLKSANTVNALVDLREPLLDMQLAMASAASPEEVKLIQEATVPLAELKVIVAAAIRSPQTSEASQVQMKPVLRMLEDIEAEVSKVSKPEVTSTSTAASPTIPEGQETPSVPQRPPEEVERAAVALTGVHFALSTALERVNALAMESVDALSLPGKSDLAMTARQTAEQSAASNLVASIEELRQCVGTLAVAIGTPVTSTQANDQYSYDLLFDELARLEEPLLNLQKVLLTEQHGPEDRHVLNDVASPIRSLKEVVQDVTREIGGGSTPIVLELIEDVEKDVSLIAMEALKKALAGKSEGSSNDVPATTSASSMPGEVPAIISKWLDPIEDWLTSTAEEGAGSEDSRGKSVIAPVVDDLKRELLKIAIQTSYSEPPSDVALIEALTELQEPLSKVCRVIAVYHEPENVDIVEGLIQPTKHLLGTIFDASLTHEAGKVLRPVLEAIEELENQIPLTIKRATYERELQRVVRSMTPEDTLITEELPGTSAKVQNATSLESWESLNIAAASTEVTSEENVQNIVQADSNSIQAQAERFTTEISAAQRAEGSKVTIQQESSTAAITEIASEENVPQLSQENSEFVQSPAEVFDTEKSAKEIAEASKVTIDQEKSSLQKMAVQVLSQEDSKTLQTTDESSKPEAAKLEVTNQQAEHSLPSNTVEVITVDNRPFSETMTNLESQQSTSVASVMDTTRADQLDLWTLTLLGPLDRLGTAVLSLDRSVDEQAHGLLCRPLDSLHKQIEIAESQFNRPAGQSLENDVETIIEGFLSPVNQLHSALGSAVAVWESGEQPRPIINVLLRAIADSSTELCELLDALRNKLSVQKSHQSLQEQQEDASLVETINAVLAPLEDVKNLIEQTLKSMKFSDSGNKDGSDASVIEERRHGTVDAVAGVHEIREEEESVHKIEDSSPIQQKAQSSEEKGLERALVTNSESLAAAARSEETAVEEELNALLEHEAEMAKLQIAEEVVEKSRELTASVTKTDVAKISRRGSKGKEESLDIEDTTAKPLEELIEAIVDSSGPRRVSSSPEGCQSLTPDVSEDNDKSDTLIEDESVPDNDLTEKGAVEGTSAEGVKDIGFDERKKDEDEDKHVKTGIAAIETDQMQQNIAVMESTDAACAETVEELNKDKANVCTDPKLAQEEIVEGAVTAEKAQIIVMENLATSSEEVGEMSQVEKTIEALRQAEAAHDEIAEERLEEVDMDNLHGEKAVVLMQEILAKAEGTKPKSLMLEAAKDSLEDVVCEDIQDIDQQGLDKRTAELREGESLAEAGVSKPPETRIKARDSEISEASAAESLQEISVEELEKQKGELREGESLAKVKVLDAPETRIKARDAEISEASVEESLQELSIEELEKQKGEIREAESLAKVNITDAPETRIEARDVEISEASAEESLQEISIEQLEEQKGELREGESLGKVKVIDAPETRIKARNAEISEAAVEESLQELSIEELEKQKGEIREAECLAKVKVTDAPEMRIKARAAEISEGSAEECLQEMTMEEMEKQKGELREGESLAKVKVMDATETRIKARDAEISESSDQESLQELSIKEMEKQKGELREGEALAKVKVLDAPETRIKARDAELSETSDQESLQEMFTEKVDKQKVEICQSESLSEINVTAAPETLKAGDARISEASEAAEIVHEIPTEKCQAQLQKAGIGVEDLRHTAEIAIIRAAEVAKLETEEIIEAAKSTIVEMVETPTQKIFKMQKKGTTGGQPEDIVETIVIKPVEDIVAMEDQQIVEIVETSAEKIIKVRLAVERNDGVIDDVIEEIVIKKPGEGWAKSLIEEQQQAVSVSEAKIQEFKSATISDGDVDTGTSQQLRSVDKDSKDRETEQADRGEADRLEKEHLENQEKGRQEADRLKREEVERMQREEKERLKREETERLQRDEDDRLKREEAERLQRDEDDRLKREEAERLQREEVERLKREEAERLQREEEERVKREEAERMQRGEEERLKHEEAERLQREEEERVKREEAERMQREQEERLKREETERLQREEEERLKREEVERLQKEEEERLKREKTERLQREEEERLKREETERLQREEEERLKREETERLQREEEERLKREEAERLQREEEERLKHEEAERLQKEEEERVKREEIERRQREEEERLKREEAERLQREEAERIQREEAERMQREEEERLKREEAERLQREEAERLKREEAERMQREEEERLKREEAERLQREEAERLKREEAERLQREEEERLKREEAERLQKEEAERLKREEAERMQREEEEILKREEAERLQREEAERLKREEAERLQREEEERLKREEAERLQREEAERLKREEAERMQREDEERLKREEAERLQREEAERLKCEEAERMEREEQERLKREEAERLQREEAERLKREEAERVQREEEERLKREEAERMEREEQERLKREEAERLQREEAERLKREEAERMQREEEERVKREEAERLQREEAERLKREEAERLQREEAERLKREEAERMQREEEERLKREEAERLQREEAERLKREEAERMQREEEERLKREEAERLQREEAEKLKHEEAERMQREEEERLKREEAERLQREEAERLKREEAERMQKEEEDRLKREEVERMQREEEERLKREEAERMQKEEEDRLKREEVERMQREEEERLKREEAERLQREEEERLKREEAERLQREEEERLKREKDERLQREELERKKQDAERLKNEEEERLKQEEAERLEKEALELQKKEVERLKQEEIDRAKKEEDERLKNEEAERLSKEALEQQKQEAERLKQEELDRAKKAEEERLKKEKEERVKKEELEQQQQEDERLKKEEAEKLKQAEEDRKKQETERLNEEKSERMKKEEAAELEKTKEVMEKEEDAKSKKKERRRSSKKGAERLKNEEEEATKTDEAKKNDETQRLENEKLQREEEAERLKNDELKQQQPEDAQRLREEKQGHQREEIESVDKEDTQLEQETEAERLKHKKELKRQQKEEAKRLKKEDSKEEAKRSSRKSQKQEILSKDTETAQVQAASSVRHDDQDDEKTPVNSEEEIREKINERHVRVQDTRTDREPRSSSTIHTDSEMDSEYSESSRSVISRDATVPTRRRSAQKEAIEENNEMGKERSNHRGIDRSTTGRTREDTLSSADEKHYTPHYLTTSRFQEFAPGPRDRGKKPSFCTKLTDRTAAETSRIKLTCTVLGEPEPQVYWTKDGKELSHSSNRHCTTEENGMVSLELYAASPKDSGEYSCVAKNVHGQAHTEAKLKVYAGYEPAPAIPTFTRSIKDTYHSTENELVLECRVRGQPSPKIEWLKDGQVLQISDRYQQCDLGDGICRLKISNPDFHDGGLYTCRAENESKMSDRTSHVVNFERKDRERSAGWRGSYRNLTSSDRDTGRPRFSSYLTDHSVPAGGTIALQVEVKGVPPPDITWMRGDRREPIPAYKARTFADSGVYTLIVPEATESETGTYVCRASNAYGYVDTAANIEVISSGSTVGGKPAMFVSRPAETMIHVTVGEDVSVSFRVNGVPKPRIVWMKGLRDITNGPRSYKESHDDYVRLTLKRALVSDEGTYCILAKNRYGCDRTFYTVKVKQRARSLTPSPDWGSLDTDNLLANIHDTERSYLKQVPGAITTEPVVIDGGRNWLALSWGKAVQHGPAPVVAYRVDAWLLGGEGGARWAELGITPVNAFDAFNLRPGGEYKFRITPRNRYGWGDSVTMTNSVTVRGVVKFPEFSKILPGQLKALRGETLHLECEVRSESKAEVKWYRDTTDVSGIKDPRYMSYYNGSRSTLTVQAIKEHDSGRYVCEATNPAGRVSTFARVQVVTDPKIVEADEKLRRMRTLEPSNEERPPEFTMRLRDRRVQMTYPVRLTCQVSGHPEPEVTWFKNREELFQDENVSFWDDESHFHTLEISHSSLEDSGIYMAKARNVNGSVSCRCHLVVDKGIRAYVAPEFFRHLDAVYTVKCGGELRMTAQIEAYPTVGIVWHRDGHRLRPSRSAVMTLNHDGSVELSLAYVTPRDAGLYCCTATNEVGRTESTTRVTVLGAADEEAPSIAQSLPDVVESLDVPYSKEPLFVTKPLSTEAVEGDTVIILCEVVGDPKPEVIWLRDFLRPDYYRDAAHFRRVGAGPQYRLEIPYAKLDFTGAYSVIAKNCHGQAKAVISLQIYARGQGKADSSMEQSTIKHGNVQTLPSIKRPLRDLRCCDGDAVTLICRVHATPEPDVRWEKSGKLVPLGEDFAADFDGETARLSIQHVYPEDEGEYTCVVYNDLGKAFTSACLIVDVPEGKESALSRKLTRPVGLLSAESTPISTPRSTPVRSLSPSCVTSRRELKPAVRTSRGQSIGRRPRLPTGPKFYAVPHNRVAEEGETVRFQCAVAGHPAPWVTWDKDGIPVTPTARISLKEKDDVRILEITEITHEDAGLYRITLENDVGRTEATARLEIIKGRHSSLTRTIRTRSASPRTYSIYSRSPITSAIRGDTHLRPNINDSMSGRGGTLSPTLPRWHHRNGMRPIESPEPARKMNKRQVTSVKTPLKNGVISATKQPNPKLSLSPKPRSSSVPRQNENRRQAPTNLTNARQTKTISGPRITNEDKNRSKKNSTVPTTTNGSMIPKRLPIDRSRSPKIGNKITNVNPKDSIDLANPDEISAISPISIAEIFEDTAVPVEKEEPQKPGDRKSLDIELSNTNSPQQVELSPPRINREISVESSRVIVEDRKESRPPVILAAPADVIALRGAKVILLATFEGEPQPRVRWLRKGRDVRHDDRAEIETSRGLTCLTLESVTTEQTGKYAVTLENNSGRDCRYVNVTVEGVPDPPAGTPCVQSITRAGKAIVTWRSPPYDGGCAVTGYNVEMKRGEEPCWIAVAEARHSLSHTVTGLVPEETYSFRVRAENAHGVSEPSTVSDVVTVPGENDEEIGGQVFVAEINQIEIEEEEEEFEPAFEARIVSPENVHQFEERYDVLEELGKGRYGVVRRILEKSSGLNLAAKFVRTIKAKDRQQVHEEIGIMNMLRHPKLLRLAAAFESPKEMIMVTEYISGGELFERVVADDFTLTEKDSIQFVKQICEGVEYMHTHSVVHLDLKPENIMCHTRTSHRIKLIDFGLAQTLKPDTPVRVLFGTPEFIPPEIIGFEPIGTESDMWSVGVICYVLLTGLSPFMGDNDAETFANITRADYDFDDKAFTAISHEAKDFISALLIKRKELRMSAKQCLEHDWLAQRAESMSRVALPTDKLKKFIVRRKWQTRKTRSRGTRG